MFGYALRKQAEYHNEALTEEQDGDNQISEVFVSMTVIFVFCHDYG